MRRLGPLWISLRRPPVREAFEAGVAYGVAEERARYLDGVEEEDCTAEEAAWALAASDQLDAAVSTLRRGLGRA